MAGKELVVQREAKLPNIVARREPDNHVPVPRSDRRYDPPPHFEVQWGRVEPAQPERPMAPYVRPTLDAPSGNLAWKVLGALAFALFMILYGCHQSGDGEYHPHLPPYKGMHSEHPTPKPMHR